MKQYIKFIIGYHLVPTIGTFYYLSFYINPILAYIISCTIWGSVLYKFNGKIKLNN